VIPQPRFEDGAVVVLRRSREAGKVSGKAQRQAAEWWYRVRFEGRIESVVEEDLDAFGQEDVSVEGPATEGRWGRLEAFRRALALVRIEQTSRNTLFAYRARRILFEPYQYKPLLKFLDSPDRRLLIADEVGLGKTIEAGLVLTEIEAREALDKVLVVCPSRLRDKWREELNRKFDQDFEILDRGALEAWLRRLQESPRRSRLRGIVSLQTMRNEELREVFFAHVSHIDFVVIDEAHHARNPETATSELLRELAGAAGACLLLTATPLHLGMRDLFTLVAALRPTEYQDATVFESELRAHQRILEAAQVVRNRAAASLAAAAERVEGVYSVRSARDPLAEAVVRDLRNGPPTDRAGWVDLERRVQDLHLLSSIVTRTRKRDVLENAPVRRPAVHRCQFTAQEQQVYSDLVDVIGPLGWPTGVLSFAQIQLARQAASCLPAVVRARGYAGVPFAGSGDEVSDVDREDLALALPADGARDTPHLAGTLEHDTKLATLIEILSAIRHEEPDAKVLIFTYFVGTSLYLAERLTAAGWRALRIAGDVPSDPRHPERDERGRVLVRFRDDAAVHVLVSTEVGSEGLDFQFCHHLVNYDLPWNPMVVEQRIGRIDRFGQESPVVHVHNLVVDGTVEQRILYRLYERIGIFEQSLGELEAILGDTMRGLLRDYVSGRLTSAEADRRVEDAARAIENRRHAAVRLAARAGDLLGHEEYIRGEMERVGRLGRYVPPQALLALLRAFLEARHPDVRIFPVEGRVGVFGVRPTEELRAEVQTSCPPDVGWDPRRSDGLVYFTMDGELAFKDSALELLNVTHPLVKAALRAMPISLRAPQARVAQATVTLDSRADPDVSAGMYFAILFVHEVRSLRERRVLEPLVWSEERQTFLDAEVGERLLFLTSEAGAEWDRESPAPSLPRAVWDAALSEARSRNRQLRETERQENEARFARRKSTLDAEHTAKIGLIRRKLATAQERGRDERVLRLFHAQIEIAQRHHTDEIARLVGYRDASATLRDPEAICAVEVRRREGKR
jgi:superfamily II DNA or RNA helicase